MEPDKKLKVLIVGSGGREHALVLAVKRSPMLDSLVCAPGNGGIGRDCETVNISAEDVDAIVEYVLKNKIDFVICGPEVPLWLGLADKLREKSVPVYGPSKNGAILEASKAYSKNFLKKYSIPTAEGANFTDPDAAEKYIRSAPFDTVIKASGLAAGKGVVLAADKLGKLKTTFQDIAIALLLASITILGLFSEAGEIVALIGLVCFYVCTLLTILSGVNYIVKNKQVLAEDKPQEAQA